MSVEAAGGTSYVLGEVRSILFAELTGLHKWSALATKSSSLQELADSRCPFEARTCYHAGAPTNAIEGQRSASLVYLQAGILTFVLLVLILSTARANSNQNPCILLFFQMNSLGEGGLKVFCDSLL